MDNELVDAFNDGSWTVFAPTNDAFANAPPFPAGIDIAAVLKGHVAENVMYFEDLACTEKTTMLNGKQTRTVCKNGTTYQKGKRNSNHTSQGPPLSSQTKCIGHRMGSPIPIKINLTVRRTMMIL